MVYEIIGEAEVYEPLKITGNTNQGKEREAVDKIWRSKDFKIT